MDKYEYKVRAEEIKELIAQGEYVQAADIADTIDWRRVKSVIMLCTISDLYKINRRYEDAKNMLLLAYERRPGGRTICYSLCELCIKTEEFVQAVNYYKEFVQVAPKDSGRYILQYKLYEAQDVSLEERIGVLEELKKRDYREKWAYELAYLYHRVGLATRCVEECDELILWFGEGKYVVKAMELKMLHQPLNSFQQEKYDRRFDVSAAPAEAGQGAETELAYTYEESQNSSDLQEYPGGQDYGVQEISGGDVYQNAALQGDTIIYEGLGHRAQNVQAEVPVEPRTEELDIQVKTMDMGKYNTLNLQAELAAGLREVLGDDRAKSEAITRSIVAPMMDTETLDYPMLEDEDIDENDVDQGAEVIESTEVFFGETGELGTPYQSGVGADSDEKVEELLERQEIILSETEVDPELLEGYDTKDLGLMTEQSMEQEEASTLSEVPRGPLRQLNSEEEEALLRELFGEELPASEATKESAEPLQAEEADPIFSQESEAASDEGPAAENPAAEKVEDETAEIVMNQMRLESLGRAEAEAMIAQPPRELAGVLAQESDGQISLVMPESEPVEKQITGQMNIQDILVEWERMKQENEERRKEEVRQRVLQQTGEMFTEFDASVRDGLLEQLETDDAEGLSEDEEESLGEEAIYGGEEFDGENLEGDTDQEAGFEAESEADEIDREADGIEAEVYAGDDFGEVEELEEIEEPQEPVEPQEPNELDVQEAETDEEAGEEPLFEETSEEEAVEDVIEEIKEEVVSEEAETNGGAAEAAIEKAAEETKETIKETATEPEKVAAELKESTEESKESAKAAEVSQEPPTEEESKAQDEKSSKDQPPVERDQAKVRALTREERELYAPFIQSRSAREQLVKAIDNISMAAYTGNIIITGDEGMDTITLAKNMIREIQLTDSNFSGKVAKITGQALNKKDVDATLKQLGNGALIIQKASGMNRDTVIALHKALQHESMGIVVVLEDTKKAVKRLLEENKELETCFTARMDVEALDNDTLVAFGRQYAKEMEYSIDDLGVLALHTRIDELQTIDHAVTVIEVKEMVDEAIRHANKKTLGHFIDILLAKRYDSEDMIILTEKDFA